MIHLHIPFINTNIKQKHEKGDHTSPILARCALGLYDTSGRIVHGRLLLIYMIYKV